MKMKKTLYYFLLYEPRKNLFGVLASGTCPHHKDVQPPQINVKTFFIKFWNKIK